MDRDMLVQIGAGPYADALLAGCAQFNIIDVHEQAMFLAQLSHESGGFLHVVENLNYSGAALWSLFESHFASADEANSYARQPERIANRIYANRLGNGPEASGDGWSFRGRALLQLTGRDNYTACSKILHGDDTLIVNPDLLAQTPDAAVSACWYWSVNGLAALAEPGTMEAFVQVSAKINCGRADAPESEINGLQDRVARWQQIQVALGVGG